MDITSDNGFINLSLQLEELHQQPDGSQTVTARGNHQGQPLGFRIRLNPGWEKGSFAGQITWRAPLILESLGAESDAFLAVLSELYGEPLASPHMAARTNLTAITLQGDPRDLRQGLTKIKLFHEPETDAVDENAIDAIYAEQYFELYLNLDANAGQVEFKEKDEGYRAPLLRILSAVGPTAAAAPATGWNFSSEKWTGLPLPPEESFGQLFSHLDPAENSFFILDAPNGDYIQCGGSPERCLVEVRYWEEGSPRERYRHFAIGRKSGGTADAAIKMSGGDVIVKENEILTSAEAVELFSAFHQRRPFPAHYVLRQTAI